MSQENQNNYEIIMDDEVYQNYIDQLPKNINDACRFCAKTIYKTYGRNNAINLTQNMINIFAKITQIESEPDLNFTSSMVCKHCQKSLATANQIITKFQSVNLFWKRYLNLLDPIKIEIIDPVLNLVTEQMEEPQIDLLNKECHLEVESIKIEPFFEEENDVKNGGDKSDNVVVLKKECEDFVQLNKIDKDKCRRENKKNTFVEKLINPADCTFCNCQFVDQLECVQHFNSEHHQENKCIYCQKTFITAKQLGHHVFRHTCPDGFKCLNCSDRFNQANELMAHKCPKRMTKLRLICEICSMSYNNIKDFNSHRVRFHREPKITTAEAEINNDIDNSTIADNEFQCENCQSVFYTERELNRHELCCGHEIPHYYYCYHCAAKFRIKSRLINHVGTHKKLVCTYCSKLLSSKHMREHVKHHLRTEADSVTCTECNKTYLDQERYLAHRKYVHNDINYGSWQCKQCPKKFLTEKQLKNHQRFHTIKTYFECTICTKKFSQKYAFQNHIRSHTEEPAFFMCDICGHGVSSKRFLEKHMQRDHKPNDKKKLIKLKLVCPLCQHSVNHSISLKKHLRRCHTFDAAVEWEQIKPRICIRCNLMFDTIEEKTKHLNETHQRISCELCVKQFSHELAYQYHLKTHPKKERPFKCDICGLAFIMKAHMKNHQMAIHVGKKDHRCDQCDGAFLEKHQLEMHKRRAHVAGKHCSCQICGKKFRTNKSVTEHMQKHSGVFRFYCNLCNINFFSSYQLTLHNTLKHPKENLTISNNSSHDILEPV